MILHDIYLVHCVSVVDWIVQFSLHEHKVLPQGLVVTKIEHSLQFIVQCRSVVQ